MRGFRVERYEGDSVMIGDDIEVQVVRVDETDQGDCVTLKIRAPSDMGIWREEVYRKRQEGNR